MAATSKTWKSKCPVSGHVAAIRDWKQAGTSEGEMAFSCVGRCLEKQRKAFEEKGPGPCSYAGGGLFRLNPITVTGFEGHDHQVFEFAD